MSGDYQTEIVKVRTGPSIYTTIYSAPASKVKSLRIYGRGGDDRIDVSSNNNNFVVINGGHGADWIKTGGFDCLAFGDYDPLTASEPDDNAADTLIDGSNGDCTLYGQGGNDKLFSGMQGVNEGYFNSLTMWGGPGKDTIDARIGIGERTVDAHGGSGNDLLRGGGVERFVTFHGDSGVDTVDFTGEFDDLVIRLDNARDSGGRWQASEQHYLLGNDIENATGGAGSDEIYGNDGKNVLRGGKGHDHISGYGGNDTLYGDDGYDVLNGGFGTDVIHGGNESDILYGGNDSDFLYGEGGNDTYWIDDNAVDYVVGDSNDTLGNGKDNFDVVVGL
jgi:Ca2+-binding RTX toxin-like protein